MRFRAPADVAIGRGELLVKGTMIMKVRRCEGADGCAASVTVNCPVPVDIAAAER
jgi:hypothetical protein